MLNGEELSSAYASADIFMMPSESETLGFVALEAMASGLAVVAVAAGGLVDIITNPGVSGIADPPSMSRGLLAVLLVQVGGRYAGNLGSTKASRCLCMSLMSGSQTVCIP